MPNAHGALVNACISYINARGGYAFKVQSGVLPVAGRYVHAGKPGVPDVVGVWPEDWCSGGQPGSTWHTGFGTIGRLIAVECKTGSGRLSAIQRRVHAELAKRGALVLTVRNIGELEAALR